VVAAPVGRGGLARLALAVVAVAFLVAMVWTGGRRENQQLVRFQPAGLMRTTAEAVERVELSSAESRLAFERAPGGGWRRAGGGVDVPATVATSLDTSLRFMHAAAPVRVLEPGEWRGTPLEEFGLAPPRYEVRLSGGGRQVLTVRFGGLAPQDVMQYARVEGEDERLYLMPRFVGQEWEKVEASAGQASQ
jgi:hypothetical protein